jgi:hypothetical protein
VGKAPSLSNEDLTYFEFNFKKQDGGVRLTKKIRNKKQSKKSKHQRKRSNNKHKTKKNC